jgi:hypothetical protein
MSFRAERVRAQSRILLAGGKTGAAGPSNFTSLSWQILFLPNFPRIIDVLWSINVFKDFFVLQVFAVRVPGSPPLGCGKNPHK